MYDVGIGGEFPTFVGYWDHFKTAFIKNREHIALTLPLARNNIIAPFPHKFSFLQLLFYNLFGVFFAITTGSSTNVCFLLSKMLRKLYRIVKIVSKH